MALDLSSLKTALEGAFGMSDATDPTAQANIKTMADTIAIAIDTFVKSGTVTVVSNGSDSNGDSISGLPGTGSVS